MEPYATIDEAKAAAVESLPKDTVAEMTDYLKIQQWLMTVTAQNKLPSMLFIDKEDYDGVPALMQKLSYWVDDSFQLAVVPNGSPELKQQLGITQTPFLIVMIPQETENPKDPDGPKSVSSNTPSLARSARSATRARLTLVAASPFLPNCRPASRALGTTRSSLAP